MAGKALIKQGEKRRKDIVKFIGKYRKAHPYGPTITEVAEAVKLGSANATRHHLLKLREEGVIIMEPRIARSIELVENRPVVAKKPRAPRKPKPAVVEPELAELAS